MLNSYFSLCVDVGKVQLGELETQNEMPPPPSSIQVQPPPQPDQHPPI